MPSHETYFLLFKQNSIGFSFLDNPKKRITIFLCLESSETYVASKNWKKKNTSEYFFKLVVSSDSQMSPACPTQTIKQSGKVLVGLEGREKMTEISLSFFFLKFQKILSVYSFPVTQISEDPVTLIL